MTAAAIKQVEVTSEPTEVTQPVVKKVRKERSDKGKKRGSYKARKTSN